MSTRRDDHDQPGPRPPAARNETVRDALRRVLRERPATLQELSVAVSVAEKQLVEHMEHLARSLAREHESLIIEPSRCLACRYRFEGRTRITKPGRCPQCKSTRISPPCFQLQ